MAWTAASQLSSSSLLTHPSAPSRPTIQAIRWGKDREMNTSRSLWGWHRWIRSAMSTSEGRSCVGSKVREARLNLVTKTKRGNLHMGWGGVGVGGSEKEERKNSSVSVQLGSSKQISWAFSGSAEGRIKAGEDEGRDEGTRKKGRRETNGSLRGIARESGKHSVF